MGIGDDSGVLHVLHGGDRSLLITRFATKESGCKGGEGFNYESESLARSNEVLFIESIKKIHKTVSNST